MRFARREVCRFVFANCSTTVGKKVLSAPQFVAARDDFNIWGLGMTAVPRQGSLERVVLGSIGERHALGLVG